MPGPREGLRQTKKATQRGDRREEERERWEVVVEVGILDITTRKWGERKKKGPFF